MTITLTLSLAEAVILRRALEMHRRVQPLGMRAPCTALVLTQRLEAAVEARETEQRAAGTATSGSGV